MTTKLTYTKEQIKDKIVMVMCESKSTTWSAADVCKRLFGSQIIRSSSEYRRVLRALHELKAEGLVDGENRPGANTVTTWWLS